MRDIGLIIATSMRNNLRLKVVVIVQVSVTLICILGVVLGVSLQLIAPAVEAGLPDRSEMALYLILIVYGTCLIGIGINMNVFAFQTMTREKSRGNIESLLATPLNVKDIWIAKSLAVFLPGLVIGVCLALISLIVINYVYLVPSIGFLITPWMVISGFVVVPLIYLCLSLLAHLIGLTGKPVTANVIVQVFLPVTASLMINLGAHHILDVTSWPFALANVAIAAVAGVAIILLMPRLTRERIVLSR